MIELGLIRNVSAPNFLKDKAEPLELDENSHEA